MSNAQRPTSMYQIKLPQFEGPFDLLLFFIERDELDIYNIPIHGLTAEFLAYIKQLKEINIELASEFILFISTLMRIKARMLLPRRELDATGQEIDPRQELVERLLEYKRYKEASESMAALEEVRQKLQARAYARTELAALGEEYSEGTEIQTVTLYKLTQAFARAMKKLEERNAKPQHVVVKYNYSQEGQRMYLLTFVRDKRSVAFEAMFSACENRIHAIFTFLAMLELVQMRSLSLLTGEGRNNFIVEWCEGLDVPEEETAEPTNV